MKKVIVVTLAVVAGLGPLLLVVGAIIAALPLLAAAFAVITGPIALIVAGVAALSIGLIAVISGSRNATAEFKEQKTAVDGLQKSVTPLLDRYDQLKAKSNLTKAEQEELRKIIEQVGGQIPTTITAFDAYGKALDINSDAARNFVKAQQEILSVKNLPALTKQRAEYKRLTEEIGFTSAALRNLDKDGSIVKQSSGLVKRGEDYESVINTVKLTGKEIAALQAKLSDLSTARRGVGGLIDELKGITPPLQKGGDAADSTAGKIDKSAKKMAEALAALNK
jgi:hypothetical protein